LPPSASVVMRPCCPAAPRVRGGGAGGYGLRISVASRQRGASG
jgi:hypothetical protein